MPESEFSISQEEIKEDSRTITQQESTEKGDLQDSIKDKRKLIAQQRESFLASLKPNKEKYKVTDFETDVQRSAQEEPDTEDYFDRSVVVMEAAKARINELYAQKPDGFDEKPGDEAKNNELDAEIKRLYALTKAIQEKQQQILGSRIQHFVDELTAQYTDLFQDIKDPMIREIRTEYGENVLISEIDARRRDFIVDDADAETFKAAIRENAQVSIPLTEISTTTDAAVPGGFYAMRSKFDLLVDDSAEKAFTRTIAYAEKMDLVKIIEACSPFFNGSDRIPREKIEHILRNKDHSEMLYDRDFQEEVSRQLSGYTGRDFNRESLIFWNVIKKNNTMQTAFTDVVMERDTKIYDKVFENAAYDTEGNWLDLLAYYPQPESIGLIALQAISKSNRYGTTHANVLLKEFAEREDWPQLVDETIAKYPALENAKDLFLHWNFVESYQNPEIGDKLDAFAIDTFTQTSDSRLVKLALDAMPNSAVLDHLTQIGKIESAQAEVLRATTEKITYLEREYALHRSEKTAVPIHANSFISNLRTALQNCALSQSDFDFETNKKSINTLTVLAEGFMHYQDLKDERALFLDSEVINITLTNKIDPALVRIMAEKSKGLLGGKYSEMRKYIFENPQYLFTNESDLQYINSFIGNFGQRALPLLKDYIACLDAGVITMQERNLLIEFSTQFSVLHPEIISQYKQAKEEGKGEMFVLQLKDLAGRMIGVGNITDEERQGPLYKSLLTHVYTNNAGGWSSYERNDRCQDRSEDLTGYTVRKQYEIDLLSNSEITLKNNTELQPQVIEDAQKPILDIVKRLEEFGNDKALFMEDLQRKINDAFTEIVQQNRFTIKDISQVSTIEEKLFLLMTDSLYGKKVLAKTELQNFLISYEFAQFEDIQNYIAGTSDRVSLASNPEYALLCELDTFYADRIKEVNRHLIQAAYENDQIREIMPQYFEKLGLESSIKEREEFIHKNRINTLGLSDQYLDRAAKLLQARNGKQYTREEVIKIIERYESYTGGLQENNSIAKNPQTRAFYGQLRSQRERTFSAYEGLTGESIDRARTNLGEISFEEALAVENNIRMGNYNEEQFAAYTVQRFLDLFESQQTVLKQELDKFVSTDGNKREKLHAFITKKKESAHARMVGGVCVSGDNPNVLNEDNLWDMPNYLQMVLQEPDTLRCQGLVLMHTFEENGRKLLSVSLNPSSTYLYSVDETALFEGLYGALTTFASDNQFDAIVVSKNHTIRTNRTGGQFERAMDKKIHEVNKDMRFDPPKQFSYKPQYVLADMDMLWEIAA